jgi:triacylglycerol lipase
MKTKELIYTKIFARCSMLPIVFIHGLCGGRYEYQPILRFLRRNGFEKFYEFDYSEKYGGLSMRDLAKQFERYVAANVPEKEFNIIGISQGGIIARQFIAENKRKVVKNCITLCSPHKGSLMAYLSRRPGILDLRPGSAILRSLHDRSDKTRYYAVHTPFDLMVFPGKNAILDGALENKRVLSLLHPLAFWSRPTLRFILRVLMAP